MHDMSPGARRILTSGEIADWPVAPKRPSQIAPRTALHDALRRTGRDGPLQMAGRHFAMGCIALEITQRCNLDCSLCYLSDVSEATRDLPLAEIYRRIDRIRHDYGPHTNVQITGGDPTLRDADELVAIVARVREAGLTPSLFTNGIRARRPLLKRLAAAGLRDVAFHVDMTQNRKGYADEAALNAVRDAYI
ncbi:MAG: radical SAM protein, partial [Pseudomonadota bacterium]